MGIDRAILRWNGWGLVEAPDVLGSRGEDAWRWLGRTLGVDPLPSTPARLLEEITLPESRLAARQVDALCGLLGREAVETARLERARHARGRGYVDLLHLRAGHLANCPDAVVFPADAIQVQAVLAWASREGVAVVPYGGGSSVVGGVTALRGECAAVITLDTSRLDRVVEIDERSRVARVQAGIYGPALERSLRARGWTLGHYPQSFEFSTLGGWIAAAGAGQQSDAYGTAADWLVSARVVTPDGVWSTEDFPATAAGPTLTHVVIGSEGTLGVIVEATVRIRRVPEVLDYRGFLFREFAAGVACAQALAQSRLPLAMVRLSDAAETRFFGAMKGSAVLGVLAPDVSVMIVGVEGDRGPVARVGEEACALAESFGGLDAGHGPGESWYHGRFATPYVRDPMLDRGLGVDTLETATRWAVLPSLHATVVASLSDAIARNAARAGARGVVMAHVSHSYPDGASLYFTFVFLRDLAREVDQWTAIKAAASEAIVAGGGTITHHHGVGTDHLPWMGREKGPIGMAVLRAIKRQVDPVGILNPGKLYP